MKKNIHPVYYHDTQVVCSCGNTFTTGSTKKTVSVDVCYKCHPFYTGEHRFIDAQGNVDSFKKKIQAAKKYKKKLQNKKQHKKQKKERVTKSLKDLLQGD